jgi:3'-phosphoadenosine 5'-phosphosulfate sulfotransferase (PAPS reductase)/FAD synthetase
MPALANERQVLKLLQSQKSAILINTSGGKDSDAMLKALWDWAQCYKIPPDRIYVIHAHLQRNEWPFALEHIKTYTRKITGRDPIIVERPQGDVLQMWEDRYQRLQEQGRTTTPHWSSSAHRYCSSGAKRAQVNKAIIKMFPADWTVINCIGLRAEESVSRSRAQILKYHEKSPTAPSLNRYVYTWLPIHQWSLKDVWNFLGWTLEDLAALQAEVHENLTPGDWKALRAICDKWDWQYALSYPIGNTRMSCRLCIMANKSDLTNGIAWNPEHFRQISELERRTGFSFQSSGWISDLGQPYLSDEALEELRQAKLRNLELQRLNKPEHPTQLPLI